MAGGRAYANTYAALPPSLSPRGLSRTAAAAYVGISASKFDQMVIDGRMPKPKQIDRRSIWDRHQLDEAFDALPEEVTEAENEWDEALL
jgi:predicted DNA-binding transcriptional regulator AlpA